MDSDLLESVLADSDDASITRPDSCDSENGTIKRSFRNFCVQRHSRGRSGLLNLQVFALRHRNLCMERAGTQEKDGKNKFHLIVNSAEFEKKAFSLSRDIT